MSGRPHASLQWTLSLVVLALGAVALVRAGGGGQAGAASAQPPVALLTSQQDHDRQMRLLKISGFPPGPGAYQAATYDEATADAVPELPDPLVMNNGTKVTTARSGRRAGRKSRSSSIARSTAACRRTCPRSNGRSSAAKRGCRWAAADSAARAAANQRHPGDHEAVVGHVDNSSYPAITVNIGMTLVTPANATGPVPIVMQFGGGGPNPMPANNTPNPCAPPPGTPPRGGGARRAGRDAPGAPAVRHRPRQPLRPAGRQHPTGRRSCCRKAGATRC